MADELTEPRIYIDPNQCAASECDGIECPACPLHDPDGIEAQRWLVRQLKIHLETAETILHRMEHPRL